MEIKAPKDWKATTLGEVCKEINSGSGFPKKYQGETTGDFPFAKVGDLSKHYRSGKKTINSADNYISIEHQKEIKGRVFLENSIVFPKIGEALKNNYRLLTKQKMLFDNNVMGVTPNPFLADPEFIYYFLLTQDFGKFSVATAIPSIRRGDIESIELSLPSMSIQKSIVVKIEELFSELDSGIASLKTTQQQLGIYRQTLLKHAFEGKLTEQWRKDNADKLETPEKLLARIHQAREARYQHQLDEWQQAVKDWEEGGKEGRRPTKPKKSSAVTLSIKSDVQDLSAIAEGWSLLSLDTFIEQITAGKSFKCEEREPDQNEVGVAKVSAVTWGEYDEAESKTCTDPERVNPDYFINKDDFLFSRANTIELVGACVIAKKVTKDIMLSDKTLRIDFVDINKDYVLHYLRSHFGRKEIMERSTGNQESMRNIGQARIRNIVIPMCSLAEQQEIINQLEEKLSIIEQNEKEIDTALAKAELLRQSILKKAFSGQLCAYGSSAGLN